MHPLNNWLEEKSSVYLYSIIEKNELDPVKRKLFQDLAVIASKQADMWKNEIKREGLPVPESFRPDFRTRLVGFLLRYFSPSQLRFMLSAMKVRGLSVYDNLVNQQSHILSHRASNVERRHKGLSSAGNLRAAVFGVNDGLVSNMSLLLGVVGGSSGHTLIILSGIAGLLAGACSMAAGEYVSMRSQREFFEYQIALEKEELELYPEEEAEELAHIYQARGLSKTEAKELAQRIISNPARALDTLAREELGLNPRDLGSPIEAAEISFLSFAMGAFIPLLPFLFGNATGNLSLSIFLTAISLFGTGAILSLFTNQTVLRSGGRMLLIGAGAGCLTYVIGNFVSSLWA